MSEEITFEIEDYDQLRRLVSEAKAKIEEIEQLLLVEIDEDVPLKVQLCKRIHEEGGVVSNQRRQELANEVGMTHQAASAMLSWGGRYITRIANDNIALTERGVELLQRYGLIPE